MQLQLYNLSFFGRIVGIALIQNKIVHPPDALISEQVRIFNFV